MTRIMLLALLAVALPTAGQRSQTCKACPSVADMNEQFSRRPPKPAKPEQAKEQRQAKPRHGKGKTHRKETQLKNGDRSGTENQ